MRQIEDLEGLVDGKMALATAPAREEWNKLLPSLPRSRDLECDYFSFSEDELEQLQAKIARSAQILRGLPAGSAAFGRVPDGRRPPSGRPS